ncbi:MAG: DinB family protein [candidate division Zixibacteria bacterium]|nr:DinB family protein [candidate division Zixibacteria bacterium]
MIALTPWFERKFSFDFPPGHFPLFLERLRGAAPRLDEVTRGLAPGVLTRRFDDKWSIQEQVGHLLDLDQLHVARLDDYGAGRPELRPADLSNAWTTTANHNAAVLGELLARFRQGRAAFVRQLETADEALIGRSALHPRLQQPMRLVDMVYFVAEHDDHHIAKIRELITRQT